MAPNLGVSSCGNEFQVYAKFRGRLRFAGIFATKIEAETRFVAAEARLRKEEGAGDDVALQQILFGNSSGSDESSDEADSP